jgi:glycosyltransferase involved in cell wall biosynthesis
MAKISIITPVWNGLPWVKNCVESVLTQRFEDWELLISDNGSTDGTRDYLATLTDPRIRVFYQPQNLGILGNVNFLFQNARAPLSQFLCHDDYLVAPESLAKIVALWADAAPEIGFIRANWNQKEARNALEAYALEALPKRIEPRDADLFFFIFGCIPGNLSNVSVRTGLVEQMGWFDQRLPSAGDFEFWIRSARQWVFLLEKSDLTHVRAHPGQASKYLNRHGEIVGQLYKVVGTLFDRLKTDIPKQTLRAHATLAYDALQRWAGVRQVLTDSNREYLDRLEAEVAERDAFLSSHLRWTAFFLSGGGHWGRTFFARRLLASRLADQRSQPLMHRTPEARHATPAGSHADET